CRDEGGIRDFHVTGVQTCALPICGRSKERTGDGSVPRGSGAGGEAFRGGAWAAEVVPTWARMAASGGGCRAHVGTGESAWAGWRSEERRVGTDCSSTCATLPAASQ